ncbi:uncharacterized protein [Epargyreus clarus]|uniref:uncharacterized protein n=1 Tax=Epargyreus clarus TaxID=520877 RepID=UPI003C2DFA04
MNLEGVLACCAVCNQQTHRRCGRCLNVYYCNTEHQRQDWRRHKSDCAPKLQKQGSQTDKVDHPSPNAEDSKSDKEKLIIKPTEITTDLKQEGEKKQSKKSKRKNVKKEGRVVASDINTSQTENVAQSVVSGSNVEPSETDQTLKESVISSVVYTNRDLTKESAIVHEGSSEQEILSESAQQLSTLDFAAAGASNVLKAVNRDKMLAIPGYNTEEMRTREYPEASVRGSVAPFNNVLNSYCMDPADPSYDICQRVIQDMTQYGVCVLNNFLGKERGLLVLKEVLEMYRSGIFTVSTVLLILIDKNLIFLNNY